MKNIQYYLAGMERLTIAAVVVTKSASLTGCYRGLYSCIGLPFSKRKDMHQNPMIVFVCEHGAAKSILAAAYFNELARERNLGLTAIARGTNPDAELSAKTITGLQEDGLTSTESIPIRLTREEIESAQRVVSFCTLPQEYGHKVVVEYWDDVPPVSEDYERSRDAIVEHLKELIKTL